ncbi:rod shape-determining protein RodA [Flavobacterium sp. CBA20B-1]|uniref:rod shape-determining protein RodA n=1 Tax=unclassified Flavobacterium TaxID=196869 RepID=UPI0022254758|nr:MULTISPECIES: rod shape-determining protein RodA [unclassified Flavobacterium]WCM42896.1 rod shape-determining protein RodA [Flavobacterium sp. CBA20B-1]
MVKTKHLANQSVISNVDWLSIFLYAVLVIFGWMNIYSASLPLEPTSVFDFSQIFGKQLLFIGITIPVIIVILSLDAKVYEKYSIIYYFIGILLLMGLFVFGKTIKGQTNWYQFGGISMQPSEFAKIGTALFLSKYISENQTLYETLKEQAIPLGIILLPVAFIMLQPDTGSAMIFAVLFLVLYREGFPAWYLWTGFIAILLFILALTMQPVILIIFILLGCIIHYFYNKSIHRNPIVYVLLAVAMSAFVFSVDYVFENVLESHQKDRINVLLGGDDVNMKKEGYNLNQAMIAIGSGGWIGKGFLEGTQTKGGFVPEQHTDYIFTTVGEEWGFAGSLLVVACFITLILRIVYLSENQKNNFARIYGYCVAAILFMHFFVNVSMLIGIFPTIGVPLPFFSYGGSSLIAFTLLLFIFLKLDANKVNEW